MVHKGP